MARCTSSCDRHTSRLDLLHATYWCYAASAAYDHKSVAVWERRGRGWDGAGRGEEGLNGVSGGGGMKFEIRNPTVF